MIYFMNKTEKIPHCRDSSNYNEKKMDYLQTHISFLGWCMHLKVADLN